MRIIVAACVTLAVCVLTAGCQGDHPSWNPVAPCPHGEHRIRDVTRSPPEVCVKW